MTLVFYGHCPTSGQSKVYHLETGVEWHNAERFLPRTSLWACIATPRPTGLLRVLEIEGRGLDGRCAVVDTLFSGRKSDF